MISEKIKILRTANHMTQSEIAKQLGLTRSSVNAWEIGASIPSTMYIIELAHMFQVSTDYILDVEHGATVLDISGLDEESVKFLIDMTRYMRNRQRPQPGGQITDTK